MNKFAIVASLAAVAALTGCLDPKYVSKRRKRAQEPVPPPAAVAPRDATWSVADDATTTLPAKPVEQKPAAPEVNVTEIPVAQPEAKPLPPPPPPAAAPKAADETTVYIVQRGDTLLKIAKRYNLTMAAIKAANPGNKRLQNGDVLLGQKIVLPGRVDVGEQKVPEGAFAQTPKPAAGAAKPFPGDTVNYVVKVGDTAGAIALAHKTTVRAIADLNNIDPNRIRIGQTLRVPVGTAVAAAPAVKPVEKKTAAKKPVEAKAPAPVPEAKPTPPAPPVEEKAVEPPPPPPPPAQDYFLYTVKDGEDITGISITYDLSPSEIRQLNNLAEGAELTPGMELKLPAGVQQ